jgi:hypothetical protein
VSAAYRPSLFAMVCDPEINESYSFDASGTVHRSIPARGANDSLGVRLKSPKVVPKWLRKDQNDLLSEHPSRSGGGRSDAVTE